MAVLSVIVPVYGVDQYLHECLDSILSQTGDEIEVIAVDDCSPDRSGEILTEYAARDPRVRVETHATNRGLGAARNTGLDHATGDYVWFVDSDDWLNPGAVPAVADRVERTSPDMLVVGFERHYLRGRAIAEQLIPPGPPLPETFKPREQPRVLHTLHIACNKVIRRDFLLAQGVRFADGWYEDVSFSHPLMLAAERVGVLERVCYAYRQRPDGAITHTRTERHSEVFEQWHRVMAYVDAECPDLRGPMFQRMIWHYLGVLNHPSRIHRGHRRAFFAQVVRDYRAYRPASGYPRPDGVARVRFALVAINAFWLFEFLRAVYRSRSRLGSAVRVLRRSAGRAHYLMQRTRPMTGDAVIYACASLRGYTGSPHARSVASVLEEARGHTQGAREVLVVDDLRMAPPMVPCYETGSLAAMRAFARARLLLSNAELPNGIRARRTQRVIPLRGERQVVPAARADTAPDNPAHVG